MAARRYSALHMVLLLGALSAVSGLLLSVFYGWIDPIVASRKQQEAIDLGLKAIFPNAHTFAAIDGADIIWPDGVEEPVYAVFDQEGDEIGLFYNAAGEGWSTFRLAVGIDPDTQAIAGVRVLEHQETPGLGSRMADDSFLTQFYGKSLGDAFQSGVDVEGISGATVTTKGFTAAVTDTARELIEVLGYGTVQADAAEAAGDGAAAPVGEAVPRPRYFDDIMRLAGPEAAQLHNTRLWEVTDADGTLLGVAVLGREPGFGGPVTVVTVVDPQTLAVIDVAVVHHNETPGLGAEVAEPHFLEQFRGKTTGDGLEGILQIDGVTMAVESSQAVSTAVQRAVAAVQHVYAGM